MKSACWVERNRSVDAALGKKKRDGASRETGKKGKPEKQKGWEEGREREEARPMPNRVIHPAKHQSVRKLVPGFDEKEPAAIQQSFPPLPHFTANAKRFHSLTLSFTTVQYNSLRRRDQER